MTEAEYRARPGVNKSTLWEIRKSPAHYRHALEEQREDTKALRLGRAIHAAILQPRAFRKMYSTVPAGIDRRSKEGKAAFERFLQGAGELLTSEESVLCKRIASSVRRDPAAAALLKGCRFERPLFWTDPATGIACKCRVDALKPGVVIDVKSCADASTRAFMRDALRYGYDVQAAHYLHGVRAVKGEAPWEWYFIAVEKAPPYAVNVLRASDGFLDRGEWQRMDLMERLQKCQETNEWPGYGENELILPAWAEMPDWEE